ncbi:tRNA dimethylallyltransferase [Venustampulla echinocandica]|uniref:tRNA dimethylallyltransferase n=1 Tax=Venustampulla echinocandica TaxID=2656787 RepID=A0A370TJ26_9HELO|nr:tRNA dimethylallyltransferase [Venustampulla echinocandica]RDL35359.1 tRNA dimethylallyltransferase [Venustampulla echinocandica]
MARIPPKDPLIVVLGATGSGKSQLAVDLATRFNGEIINGDAMQMYDGLPIVTNKITVEEQKSIPHHLLGSVALDEEPWRVGMFKQKASGIIKEIRSRGRLPIVVGGTHYYTQSLLFEDSLVNDGLDGVDQTQAELGERESPETFPILEGPTEEILNRLREVDPVMATRWHPNERRKIRRSLEIFLTTGRKASDIYAEQKQRRVAAKVPGSEDGESAQSSLANGSILLFWVHADSEILTDRLNTRVDKMVQSGLLEEVKSMDGFLTKQLDSGRPVDLTRGIWVSIGWKEFRQYLSALKDGSSSPDELEKLYELSTEQTKTATRQYAKQQVRWIRLRLRSALLEENALDKLYLLDSSNIAQWDADVAHPALDITASFLDGRALPAPHEVSTMAAQLLDPNGPSKEVQDTDFRRECELCHVTVVIEDQWRQHLTSRRHRALEKKRLKRALNPGPSQKLDISPAIDIT